jgi:hypothetical protein
MRSRDGYDRYDWVRPEQERHTKEQYPYSYSEHFVWREEDRARLKTAEAVYHDRMAQWDHAKFEAACAVGPRRHFNQWSKDDLSKFLTTYFGKPTRCVALSEGANVSSGFPFFVFWFRHTDGASKTAQSEKSNG